MNAKAPVPCTCMYFVCKPHLLVWLGKWLCAKYGKRKVVKYQGRSEAVEGACCHADSCTKPWGVQD